MQKSSSCGKSISFDPRILLLCLLSITLCGKLLLDPSVQPEKKQAQLTLCISTRDLTAGLSIEKCAIASEIFGNIESKANLSPFLFSTVPVNYADYEDLIAIKGIGPTLANAILEHRRTYGSFRGESDLLAIHGIGRKTLAKIMVEISFEP